MLRLPSLLIAIFALCGACRSALKSGDATFHSKLRLAAPIYLKAPQPQAEARFGAMLKLNASGLAVAAPFEDVDGRAGERIENGGAVYVFDARDLSAPPLRLVAPNVDPNDGAVPGAARPPPLPSLDPWGGLMVDLDEGSVVVGVAGEDSAAADVDLAKPALDNSASEAGAVYVYDRAQPLAEPQYLKAPNAGSGDLFGESVALSGAWLAVGASGEDSADRDLPGDDAAPDSGAVYLYEWRDGAFRLSQYLKAPEIHPGAHFGFSVALEAELLVVGAPTEDGDVEATGAVYIHRYDATQRAWQSVSRVAPKPTGAMSLFGTSLSLHDGRVVVGMPAAPCSDPASGASAVYVVGEDQSDVWSTQDCFERGTQALFGFGVASLGPYLVAGAPWDSSALSDDSRDRSRGAAGAAYLFDRDAAGSWHEDAYVKAPKIDAGDVFGVSVGLAPGLLAIGADQESGSRSGSAADLDDNGAHYAGAVYVFSSADLTD